MNHHPVEPNNSCLTPEAAAASNQPAGRPARMGAILVDLLILFASFSLVFFPLFAALEPMIDTGSFSVFLIPILSLILGNVVFIALNFRLLRTHGQTVGKYAFKIRIVRSDGTPADLWRILLGGAIWCWHSRTYDTIVVKA